MLVRQIMTSKIAWVERDTPLEEIARKMRDFDIGCIPVRGEEADIAIGVITDRDIVCRAVPDGLKGSRITAADILSQPPQVCYAGQEVKEAVEIMKQKKLHRLLVIEGRGHVVGIVTLTDVALHSPHDLSGEAVEGVALKTP